MKKSNKEKNNLGFELKKVIDSITPKSISNKISLLLSGKTLFVKSDDILYCKADGNYSEIFFKENKKELLSKKLKDVEELIDDDVFFRVHKSYLVNINYIKEFINKDGQYLVLENGTPIPVSRSRKSTLFQLLNI